MVVHLGEDTTTIVADQTVMKIGDALVGIVQLAQLLADVDAAVVGAHHLGELEMTIEEEIVIVVIVATETEESAASETAAIEVNVIAAALLDAMAGIDYGRECST